VDKREILTRAGLKPGYTSMFFSVGDAKREILANPWIKEVDIEREFLRRKITINIRELKPFCLLLDPNGELYYLSEEGDKLGKAEPGYGLNYPIVVSKNSVDSDTLRGAIELLKLSMGSNVLKWDDVSEVDIDPVYDGLSILTNDRRKIVFGTGDLKLKWNKLEKIILHSRSINLTEQYINLESETTAVVDYKY
jgi:cell division septal protein FtsQ